MALHFKSIAHVATLVKDHCSNSLCMAAEDCELRRMVNAMEGNTLEAISSVMPLQMKVSTMAEERDAFAA